MIEKYLGSSLKTLVEIKITYYEKLKQVSVISTLSSHC